MRTAHHLRISLLACVSFAATSGAIDFTPRYGETLEEGVVFRRMFFADGTARIFFRPPATWVVSGDEAAVNFSPKDIPSALVRMESAPADHAAIAFDGDGLKKLRAIAASLIPGQFKDPVEQWETVNPVIIHGWTSFEIGFGYRSGEEEFCRSITFINLGPNRQIRLVVEAPATEFAKLHRAANRSLSTWWEVK